ncbi:MAG: alpha/beta hydrolase [Gammaproteobacteria bacterium]|nr:alpha/beta hydrolase [Gammaproteobacteria bacterium]
MADDEADISAAAAGILADMYRQGLALPRAENLAQFRAATRAGYEPAVRAAIDAFDGSIEDTAAGEVACKQVTPTGWREDDPVIQYAYGGGYVSGSPFEDLLVALPLARASGARIIMVDYRLSPEHPYPRPQQDMQQAYGALVEEYAVERIALCGESAGGNQVLGLLLHLRDRGMAMPRCAALLSPWCDLGNSGDSHAFNDGRDPSLSNHWVDLAARLHAGGHPLADPGISPLHGNLEGLPPIMITTGSRDLLLSQCLRLAQRLRAAGNDCDLRVWEGLWHVFEFYPIPEAETSLAEIAGFIRAHSRA